MLLATRPVFLLILYLTLITSNTLVAAAMQPLGMSRAVQTYLNAHNRARMQHGAANLTWSPFLASQALSWANLCQPTHSSGSLGPFGENMAAGTGRFSIHALMDLFLGTESKYDPNNPVPSQFTQIVWKNTSQVGCAVAPCSGMLDSEVALFYVCEYYPAGNVIGHINENVQV